MKPVKLLKTDFEQVFESYAECARFLESYYGATFESFRSRLKDHRKFIRDFDVIYLNAEAGHNHSKE